MILSIFCPYSIDSSNINFNSGVCLITNLCDKRLLKNPAALFKSFSTLTLSSNVVKYTLAKDKSFDTSQAVIVTLLKSSSLASSKESCLVLFEFQNQLYHLLIYSLFLHFPIFKYFNHISIFNIWEILNNDTTIISTLNFTCLIFFSLK